MTENFFIALAGGFVRAYASGFIVKNQQLGVMDDGHGESELLAHSGGIGFDGAIAFLASAAEVENLMATANCFGGFHSGQSRGDLKCLDA